MCKRDRSGLVDLSENEHVLACGAIADVLPWGAHPKGGDTALSQGSGQCQQDVGFARGGVLDGLNGAYHANLGIHIVFSLPPPGAIYYLLSLYAIFYHILFLEQAFLWRRGIF